MQEKEKRREELKRLKNLKKREILDKIEKLKDVTGDTAVDFTEQDVEGEFNEHEYDEMMKVRYCFYRAMLCIHGTSHGPVSVCPSVCLSVTSLSSAKTAKRRITQTTPHDSPGTLVF